MPLLRPDVTLTPLELSHAANMLEWLADPAVRDGIGLRSRPTPQSTHDWIAHAQQDATIRPFAIMLGVGHVGNVVLDKIDLHLQTTRFSIYVGHPSARGAGVGRSAAILALREAFLNLNLHKVWLTVHAENHTAIASYLRIGFVPEGMHRDEFLLQGRRLPALYMGILDEEFQRCQRAIAAESES